MPDTCSLPKSVHGKGSDFKSQLQILVEYLRKYVATASMVTQQTGVPQKNICRYKRDLEKAGMLWQVERKPCKVTRYRAWYLTTDPDKAPSHRIIQLNLF